MGYKTSVHRAGLAADFDTAQSTVPDHLYGKGQDTVQYRVMEE